MQINILHNFQKLVLMSHILIDLVEPNYLEVNNLKA